MGKMARRVQKKKYLLIFKYVGICLHLQSNLIWELDRSQRSRHVAGPCMGFGISEVIEPHKIFQRCLNSLK